MRLVQTVPPDPIITIPEIKGHLGIDHADDDRYLADLLEVATSAAQDELNRALGRQTWEMSLEGGFYWGWQQAELQQVRWDWHSGGWALRLPYPPLISVDSITYRDADGDEVALDEESYVISGAGAAPGGRLHLVEGFSFPTVYASGPDAVVIEFTAGYEDRAAIPPAIRHAILMMAARLKAARGELVPNNLTEDPAIKRLLAPHRVFA